MQSDAELIDKCKKGQNENFGLLYDRYIVKIYNFVYYKTQHKETAEDLVSSVFLKAVRKIGSFEPEGGSFQAWLYQIARNTVIDHYRSKKYDKQIDDIWDMPAGGDTERDTDMKIRLEKIEKYLKRLKSEQRDIIIMKIWQDMSYQEIAAALGKSEASCKMMCSRALKQLRKEMPVELFLLLLLFGSMGV